MFVIAGDAPGAEFSKEAMSEIEAAGLLENNPADSEEDDWVTPHTEPASIPGRPSAKPQAA